MGTLLVKMERKIDPHEGESNDDENYHVENVGKTSQSCVEDPQTAYALEETKLTKSGDTLGNFQDIGKKSNDKTIINGTINELQLPSFNEILKEDLRKENGSLTFFILFCIIVSSRDILDAIFIIPGIRKKKECIVLESYLTPTSENAPSCNPSVKMAVEWLNSLFPDNERGALPFFESKIITYPLGADLRSFIKDTGKSLKTMMENDWIRLSTFAGFPAESPVSTMRLSDAGFYYPSKKSDEVKCFKCGITYKDWKHDDEPKLIHKSISPSCKFIKNKYANKNKSNLDVTRPHSVQRISENAQVTSPAELFAATMRIPRSPVNGTGTAGARSANKVKQEKKNKTSTQTANTQITSPVGLFAETVRIPRLPVNGTGTAGARFANKVKQEKKNKTSTQAANVTSRTDNAKTEGLDRKGKNEKYSFSEFTSEAYSTSGCHTPKPNSLPPGETLIRSRYASFEARLHTYKGFPKDVKQTPEELADAGFFYEGKNDRVKCFSCGKKLSDWRIIKVNPWIEHSRISQNCDYLRKRGVINEFTRREVRKDANSERLPKQPNGPDSVETSEDGSQVQGTTAIASLSGTAQRVKTRDEENRIPERLCKICLEEEVEIMFHPCGHMVTCGSCAHAVTKCPECQIKIKF